MCDGVLDPLPGEDAQPGPLFPYPPNGAWHRLFVISGGKGLGG